MSTSLRGGQSLLRRALLPVRRLLPSTLQQFLNTFPGMSSRLSRRLPSSTLCRSAQKPLFAASMSVTTSTWMTASLDIWRRTPSSVTLTSRSSPPRVAAMRELESSHCG